MSQLRRRDEAIPVLIKDPEGLADFLLAVGVLHLPEGRRGEGRKCCITQLQIPNTNSLKHLKD